MRRKIMLSIISGLIGSLIGTATYLTTVYLPGMWKNKERSTIFAYIFLGFVAGCILSYLWQSDREDKK